MISLLLTFYKLNFSQTQRDRHNLGFILKFKIGENFLHVVILPFILFDTKTLVLCILEKIINLYSGLQLVFYTCLVKHDFYSPRGKQNKYKGRIYL